MSNAIEVRGLRKSYGSREVLRGLDFSIKQGEIFAILGANGAGKTTALECMEGLRRYDGGSIAVNGRIGIQLQSSALPEHIKPSEAIRLFEKWNHTVIRREILDSLEINDFASTQYKNLSTGQKRRLHIALALTCDPDIVFLDEPTAGLDVEGRLSLHKEIRDLREHGKTVVLASHDMAEVESLCSRIAVLNAGRIVFCGTPSELTDKTGKKYSVSVKTSNGEKSFETDNISDSLLKLLSDLKQSGTEIYDIKIDRGTLEQHFMEIAGRVKK